MMAVLCILLVDVHALSCHISVEYLQGCKKNKQLEDGRHP